MVKHSHEVFGMDGEDGFITSLYRRESRRPQQGSLGHIIQWQFKTDAIVLLDCHWVPRSSNLLEILRVIFIYLFIYLSSYRHSSTAEYRCLRSYDCSPSTIYINSRAHVLQHPLVALPYIYHNHINMSFLWTCKWLAVHASIGTRATTARAYDYFDFATYLT